ncbi:MAG: hypothetical protein J6N45_05375 [Alphaproteobacteria bacterium]|nr:hypothetical protein [Alphaproteobacteria bacterium]
MKLPETEESDNQAHSVPLVPIPARKPKIAEPQTTANKIVPVPARKPLPENANLEDKLQRYIAEHSPYLYLKLEPLNNANSYTTELGNTKTDAEYKRKPLNNNDLNVDEMIRRNVPQIIKEEGIVDHPYKDTKGYITVGAGLNVNNYETFCKMPWLDHNNEPANILEIHKNYKKMQSLPKGKLPIFYKGSIK